MRHGSLFSGIGGFDLAAEWMGWENVFHCEWMEFPRKVLDYYFPNADSHIDICKTDFKKYANKIDILTGDSLANHSAMQEKEKGQMMNATSGARCFEQYKKLNPNTSSQKMSLVSQILMGDWYSSRCALTWKLKGTKFNRLLFLLHPKTHRTDEIGFGLLPTTPIASEVPRSEKFAKGRTMSPSEYAMKIGLLPTPRTSDERMHWRTENWKGDDLGSEINHRLGTRSQLESPICGGDDGLPTQLDGITFSKWRAESIKGYGNAIVPQVAYELFKIISKL
jgi:DNA (cytosine-5)-methyltransferase 1